MTIDNDRQIVKLIRIEYAKHLETGGYARLGMAVQDILVLDDNMSAAWSQFLSDGSRASWDRYSELWKEFHGYETPNQY